MAPTWVDAGGEEHRLAPATITRLHELIGEAEPSGEEPAVVGRGATRPDLVGRLHLEDGGAMDLAGSVPVDVPYGYHTLETAGDQRRVIVVPSTCVPPARRMWGWVAQLYATRSASSWGIGDLGDLAEIGRFASREHGAELVMVNPLQAVFPVGEQQPSPYSPSTRRFLNPLYIRVEDVPGAAAVADEVSALAVRGRRLNESRIIDRDEVLALKLAALERIWGTGRPGNDAGFTRWQRQRTDVEDFAIWSTIVEQHGRAWSSWPAELRRPGTPELRRFATRHRDRVLFHSWLQWLLEGQLHRAGTQIGVIADLPIGFDPEGFDAWSWQDQLVLDAEVGAPPDELNTLGQAWGLPPFNPWRLRAAGYRPFIDTLRAVLRPPVDGHVSGIRIDHVLGFFRLWWVPNGMGPRDGGYVRSPGDDLLGILALESRRAGAVVIGEDLGTVDPGVPERLAAAGVLSYRALWFEEDTPRGWPVASLGTVTTHDLPTVAGLWNGEDLREQDALGLQPNTESTERIRDRLAIAADLSEEATIDDAIVGAHRTLAQAPSVLLAATLDDAAGEWRRPNIPGAGDQRPNWCLALPVPLDELWRGPRVAAIVASLTAATGQIDPPAAEDEVPAGV